MDSPQVEEWDKELPSSDTSAVLLSRLCSIATHTATLNDCVYIELKLFHIFTPMAFLEVGIMAQNTITKSMTISKVKAFQ